MRTGVLSCAMTCLVGCGGSTPAPEPASIAESSLAERGPSPTRERAVFPHPLEVLDEVPEEDLPEIVAERLKSIYMGYTSFYMAEPGGERYPADGPLSPRAVIDECEARPWMPEPAFDAVSFRPEGLVEYAYAFASDPRTRQCGE